MNGARKIRRPRRFRILVIGRANAGKTTILRRLCRADEGAVPLINGHKPGEGALEATDGRGEHNIADEITFESNPGYVFHDSRGIECGSTDEAETVDLFITERADKGDFEKRLHVIWLCLSAESSGRALQATEREFLMRKTGNVPIIVIITKCEALEITAEAKLGLEGKSPDEASDGAEAEALKILQRQFYEPLIELKHPEDQIVKLQEMNEPEARCDELVSATERCLTDDNVAQLFLVTEHFNLEQTAVIVLRRLLERNETDGWASVVEKLTGWFPHLWRTYDYDSISYYLDDFDDFDFDDDDDFDNMRTNREDICRAGERLLSNLEKSSLLTQSAFALLVIQVAFYFQREIPTRNLSPVDSVKRATAWVEEKNITPRLEQAVLQEFTSGKLPPLKENAEEAAKKLAKIVKDLEPVGIVEGNVGTD